MEIQKMPPKLLTLHISYDGLNSKIWRDIQLCNDTPMNQLAYIIMVSFDTHAYHQYYFQSCGEKYTEGNVDGIGVHDARKVTMADLYLDKGDSLLMEYDFGCGQLFNIKITDATEHPGENSVLYPFVSDGAGSGILDDYGIDDLAYFIEQIDLVGKTVEPIYYKDRESPWDYRCFSIESLNKTLIGDVTALTKSYRERS